jgi:hypothetical protein
MDPGEEMRWVDTLSTARRRANASLTQWDPDRALRAAQIARSAPWLEPGALLALSKGTVSMEPVAAAATLSAVRRARLNPTNQRAGTMVTGAQLNPGDRRLFGREREQLYFNEIEPAMQREAQAGRREEAFLGRAPGDMRPGVSLLDDLTAQGLVRDGQLVSPRAVRGEFTPERFLEGGDEQTQRFVDALTTLGGNRSKVGFVDPDGRPGVFDPVRGKLYPAGLYTEAPPRSFGELAETVQRAVPPQIGEFMEGRHLPTLGDIPGVGGTGVGDITNRGVTETAGPPSIRQGLQYGFMALGAGAQEGTGLVRNAYGEATGRDVDWWEAQSDYLISLTEGGMDPGGGLFVDPASEVAVERRARERERGQLHGRNITIGRLAAEAPVRLNMIEPDTQAYRILSGMVDLGVALYADPTVIGATRASKVSRLRHTFVGGNDVAERTGLIRGLFSPRVHGETKDAWFAGNVGSGVVRKVAEETNGGELWRRLGRQLRPAEVAPLKTAVDTESVQDVLRPMLGVQFRRTDEVWQQPSRLIEPIVDSRALTDIPTPYINLSDQDELLWQTERWLRNSRANDEVQLRFLDKMVDAQGRDIETLDVVEEMLDWSLENAGWRSASHRRQVVDGFRSSVNNARQALIDEITDDRLLDEITLGDDTFPVGNPFDFAEHATQIIPLPDPREMRRLTSQLGPLVATKDAKLRAPLSALLWWQEQIWKPFTLLRAAWTMRVVPEEALRMAAKGHASMFKDPASFVVWAAARKQDLLDEPFTEARRFQNAQSIGSGGWAAERPGRIRTGRQVRINKGDDGYFDAVATNLAELHNDEIARKVADSSGLDEVEEWLAGEGAEALATLRARFPNVMQESDAVRPYLEMTARHINVKTGGNDELLEAVRTGSLRGKPLTIENRLAVAKDLPRRLEGFADALPDAAIGEEVVTYGGRRQGLVEFLFANLMGRPTNYLSRSPEYKQSYWDRVEEMVSHATPETKDQLIASAERNLQAGPGGAFGRRAVNRMRKIEARGDLTLEQIDEVAKGFALDEVRNLLYDLSKRSQVADSMRLVSPFGEAWREVITRWITLLNPLEPRGIKNLRRFQQTVSGARGQDFGETMGVPEAWDAEHERWTQPGFFWKDEFNEEIFIYPGSQWVMNQNMRLPDWLPGIGGMGTPGIPVPLTGRVEGLNMIGSIFPGIGPVAAVPTSWFLPDKPGWQRQLREWMLPFGSVTEQGNAAILDLINYAPPWMRGATQALLGGGYDYNTNRLWANATMSTANYLYSTGMYDTTTTAGQQKLMDDAVKTAGNVYLIRSLVAFGAPSAPSPEFLVDTNEGLIRLAALREDYYALLADDPRTADEEFMARWGDLMADPGKDKAGMSMQAFTREIQGGIGVTQEFEDWSKANKDIERDYSAIWAFFGPQKGKYDYDVYLRQILSGDRQQLSLEQWMAFGQNHLGLMLKDHAESLMPEFPTEEDEQWLDNAEDWIFEHYPGYGDPTGRVERADLEIVLRQIEKAVQDDRVLSTPTGERLSQYWTARNEVVAVAEELGYKGFGEADELEEDRNWLYEGGQELARQDLGFKALWNRHLRSEVEPQEVTDGLP